MPVPNPHKGLDRMLEVDMDLNVLITEALHEIDADYVTIWQFHNGAVSFGGIPFLRISVTHQQIRSGLLGWGHAYQNLPTSLFVACRSFKEMIDERRGAVINCDEREGNETIMGILLAHRIKELYVWPIRNSNGTLIALMTFSYTSKLKEKPENFDSILNDYTTRGCVLLELQARLSKGG
jgi:hypothetical protein